MTVEEDSNSWSPTSLQLVCTYTENADGRSLALSST